MRLFCLQLLRVCGRLDATYFAQYRLRSKRNEKGPDVCVWADCFERLKHMTDLGKVGNDGDGNRAGLCTVLAGFL